MGESGGGGGGGESGVGGGGGMGGGMSAKNACAYKFNSVRINTH